MVRFLGWWRRFFSPTLWNKMERVHAEVASRQARYEALSAAVPAPSGSREKEALATVKTLLEQGWRQVEGNNEQGAWQAVHDIDEELVWTMGHKEAVAAGLEASAKYCATPGVGRKAKEFAAKLAKDMEAADEATAKAHARKLLELRNQFWEVRYHSTAMMTGRVAILAAILALLLAVFLALAGKAHDPQVLPPPLERPLFALAVAVFGMLGGATSSLLSATQNDRILPDAARDAPWHVARPLFGAAAAILVVTALSSGLLGVTPNGDGVYLAYAAVAGFTEMFLVKLMGRMAAKADEEKDTKKDDHPPAPSSNPAGGGAGDGNGKGKDTTAKPAEPAPPPQPPLKPA